MPPNTAGFLSASKLLGVAVADLDEQFVGHVRDVIVDAREGRVAYVGIDLAGANGRQAVVPWSAFTPPGNATEHCRVEARRRSLDRVARFTSRR